MNPLLAGREALMREYARVHRLVLKAVRSDPACRILMTMPGISPVSALTFRSTVDDPRRFLHSQSVGANLGLTPSDTNLARLIGWDGSQKSEMERRAQPCSKLPTSFSGHQPDGLR
ncbi:Transposase IS116/IS110/IS902 family protein [Bradyrhizobium sp. Gha]|nr:Transposase IS116/IS110/IS902 family protein [Bradyrhizobium sp. Gha]